MPSRGGKPPGDDRRSDPAPPPPSDQPGVEPGAKPLSPGEDGLPRMWLTNTALGLPGVELTEEQLAEALGERPYSEGESGLPRIWLTKTATNLRAVDAEADTPNGQRGELARAIEVARAATRKKERAADISRRHLRWTAVGGFVAGVVATAIAVVLAGAGASQRVELTVARPGVKVLVDGEGGPANFSIERSCSEPLDLRATSGDDGERLFELRLGPAD